MPAIKVNMPLEHSKMEWLADALAKTDCPMELAARTARCPSLSRKKSKSVSQNLTL